MNSTRLPMNCRSEDSAYHASGKKDSSSNQRSFPVDCLIAFDAMRGVAPAVGSKLGWTVDASASMRKQNSTVELRMAGSQVGIRLEVL